VSLKLNLTKVREERRRGGEEERRRGAEENGIRG
jgi:hypothetical protein